MGMDKGSRKEQEMERMTGVVVENCAHEKSTVYTKEQSYAVWGDEPGEQITMTYREYIERCDRCAEVLDADTDA
jgi:acyl-coenzyme A synthetase/AMP-(fatty) acid ligase